MRTKHLEHFRDVSFSAERPSDVLPDGRRVNSHEYSQIAGTGRTTVRRLRLRTEDGQSFIIDKVTKLPDTREEVDEIPRREDVQAPVPYALDRLAEAVPEEYFEDVDNDPTPRNEWESAIWNDPGPVPMNQRRTLVAWHRWTVVQGASRQRRASG